jgi:hypothetical protein
MWEYSSTHLARNRKGHEYEGRFFRPYQEVTYIFSAHVPRTLCQPRLMGKEIRKVIQTHLGSQEMVRKIA